MYRHLFLLYSMLAIILMQLIYICKHRNIEHYRNGMNHKKSQHANQNRIIVETPHHTDNNIHQTEQNINDSSENIDISTVTEEYSSELDKKRELLEIQKKKLIENARLINQRKHADEIIANIKHVQEEMY